MNLEFTCDVEGKKAELDVKGEIDVSNAPELRTAIHEALDSDINSLVIDISEVSYIDSTGIGVLVGARHRAADESIDFEILNPQPNVLRVLSLLELVDELNIKLT